MKKYLIGIAVIVTAILSCNSNHQNSNATNESSMMHQGDSMPMNTNGQMAGQVKMVTPMFTQLDPGVTSYMRNMMQQYLGIKNALVEGSQGGASSAAGKMSTMMKGFDKSLLSAEQKKVYDNIEDDLKEHAEHISKSELDHQREHFSMMSEDMYDMAKAFGSGMTLYHDHCPMYQNGSMWLSETRDIRNPYYGNKMMTCGSVEEMFQ